MQPKSERCPRHTTWVATEVCTVCRAVWCRVCVTKREGKIVCRGCVKGDSPPHARSARIEEGVVTSREPAVEKRAPLDRRMGSPAELASREVVEAGVLTAEEFETIRRQAEGEYPSVCCGVVLTRHAVPEDRAVMPCRNIQEELHRADPSRYPRDSRTAYQVSPQDLLRMAKREAEGYSVHAIYYSRIDEAANFSQMDRRGALVAGKPTYPGTFYVAMSVVKGKFAEAAAYHWDPAINDFAIARAVRGREGAH